MSGKTIKNNTDTDTSSFYNKVKCAVYWICVYTSFVLDILHVTVRVNVKSFIQDVYIETPNGM